MLVGAVRFELTTLCSQSRCATRLRYATTSFNLTPLVRTIHEGGGSGVWAARPLRRCSRSSGATPASARRRRRSAARPTDARQGRTGRAAPRRTVAPWPSVELAARKFLKIYLCAVSMESATRNMVSSLKWGPMICTPMGSPALVSPQGTHIPQMPARLAATE